MPRREEFILRCKGIADGAKTIPEAVRKIRDFADHLEGLARKHEISDEVQDDYLVLISKPKRKH